MSLVFEKLGKDCLTLKYKTQIQLRATRREQVLVTDWEGGSWQGEGGIDICKGIRWKRL